MLRVGLMDERDRMQNAPFGSFISLSLSLSHYSHEGGPKVAPSQFRSCTWQLAKLQVSNAIANTTITTTTTTATTANVIIQAPAIACLRRATPQFQGALKVSLLARVQFGARNVNTASSSGRSVELRAHLK